MYYQITKVPLSDSEKATLRKKNEEDFNLNNLVLLIIAFVSSVLFITRDMDKDTSFVLTGMAAIVATVFFSIKFSIYYNQRLGIEEGVKLRIIGEISRKKVRVKKKAGTTYHIELRGQKSPYMIPVTHEGYKKYKTGNVVQIEVIPRSGTILNVQLLF